MKAEILSLGGFRNLKPLELLPSPGVNVIWGENGQGKTNVLEALWIFTGGRSFRGVKDSDLIGFEKAKDGGGASLSLQFYSEERSQNLEMQLKDGKRIITLNGVKKRTSSQIVGKFCAVIFSPEHLSLVKSGPAGRRQFMDSALCQSKPAYADLLTGYNKVLLQRNALLKDISRHPELMDTMEIWDMRLSELGENITRERKAFAEKLSPLAEEIYRGISGGREEISFSYMPGYKGTLQEALLCSRNEDIRFRYTSSGPHRGDLRISMNGISAREFASQGQQRSAVLSMKLAEAQLLKLSSGEEPVILLDDVLSELDDNRQEYLLNRLKDRQVFLTCCSPDAALRLRQGKSFFVKEGIIEEEKR